jgi:anti-sigma B factor antagonist
MQSEIKDGVLVISLGGNLLGEHSNAPVMELITENLAAGNKKVVFNLAEMKFINSTGLGMLMTALTKTRNAGGELGLCTLPDQMKKLLQMTKLESIFPVYADEATAITTLNSK